MKKIKSGDTIDFIKIQPIKTVCVVEKVNSLAGFNCKCQFFGNLLVNTSSYLWDDKFSGSIIRIS